MSDYDFDRISPNRLRKGAHLEMPISSSKIDQSYTAFSCMHASMLHSPLRPLLPTAAALGMIDIEGM